MNLKCSFYTYVSIIATGVAMSTVMFSPNKGMAQGCCSEHRHVGNERPEHHHAGHSPAGCNSAGCLHGTNFRQAGDLAPNPYRQSPATQRYPTQRYSNTDRFNRPPNAYQTAFEQAAMDRAARQNRMRMQLEPPNRNPIRNPIRTPGRTPGRYTTYPIPRPPVRRIDDYDRDFAGCRNGSCKHTAHQENRTWDRGYIGQS